MASRTLLINLLFLNTISAYNGFPITTSKKIISKKTRKQLLNIIFARPEELAIDERLYIKVPATMGKKIKTVRKDYINAEVLEEFLNTFASAINKSPYISTIITQAEIIHAFEVIAQLYYSNLTFDQYQELKKVYSKSEFFRSINYIKECPCFSRRAHPFRREVEDRILQHLLQNYPDKKQTIVLTEFASGSLFELFIIANKIVEAGYHNLRINCIDRIYKPLIEFYQKLLIANYLGKTIDQKREFFNKIEKLAYEDFIKEYGKILQKFQNLPLLEYSSLIPMLQFLQPIQLKLFKKALEIPLLDRDDPKFEQKRKARLQEFFPLSSTLSIFNQQKTFEQFLSWFLEDKQDKVQCILYDYMGDYFEDCQEDSSLLSDIVIAIDYFAYENYRNWDWLREGALSSRGFAYAVNNFAIINPEGLVAQRYFLSEGTSKTLKHFEWELVGEQPIIWQEERKEVKIPVFTPYVLKEAHEIPLFHYRSKEGRLKEFGPIKEIVPHEETSKEEL